AQHGDDFCAGGGLDFAVQQGGDRSGCGAFDHKLAVAHDPDDGVEDVFVGERDDLVDEATHHLVRVFANALHPQAVDDAVDAIQRDNLSRLHALLHAGRAGRLDADDANVRIDRLEGHRHAGDQPAAANWDDDDL